MAKILSHPRVYSFLHVPVQSGSDAVLGEMKREYTVKQFRRVVDYLKEQFSKERKGGERKEEEGGIKREKRNYYIFHTLQYSWYHHSNGCHLWFSNRN